MDSVAGTHVFCGATNVLIDGVNFSGNPAGKDVVDDTGGATVQTYEAQLLDREGPVVRLRVPAGNPTYGNDGRMEDAEDNAIEIYFTDRWYNV